MSDRTTHLLPSLAADVLRRMSVAEMRSPIAAMPWTHPPTRRRPAARLQGRAQAQAEVEPAFAGSDVPALDSIARQVAERVYEMMRRELRIERERVRGRS